MHAEISLSVSSVEQLATGEGEMRPVQLSFSACLDLHIVYVFSFFSCCMGGCRVKSLLFFVGILPVSARPHRWDQESDIGRVAPVWSVTCPKNVTSCCIADIDGDKM